MNTAKTVGLENCVRRAKAMMAYYEGRTDKTAIEIVDQAMLNYMNAMNLMARGLE